MPVTPSYATVVATGYCNCVMVPVPFDLDVVWGNKPGHRVSGTANGMKVRASDEAFNGGFGIDLGPTWRRDCDVARGDVDVLLAPEGPQRDDLAEDIRAALESQSAAGAFFDGVTVLSARIPALDRRPRRVAPRSVCRR